MRGNRPLATLRRNVRPFMANITYIQPDGAQQTVVGEPGMTVMETAKKH